MYSNISLYMHDNKRLIMVYAELSALNILIIKDLIKMVYANAARVGGYKHVILSYV